MQFTVLIEFLVPGLATTLLALALLPCNALPQLPLSMPTGGIGDTVTALLLLAVSYPIGILVNFPIYQAQRHFLTPRVHRAIVTKYAREGVNLSDRVIQYFNVKKEGHSGVLSREELRDVFSLLRVSVFARNINRLNSQHLYYESLQRLARGMLVPLLLAGAWVWGSHTTAKVFLVSVLGLLCAMSFWLLCYSIRAEEDQVARFFIVLAWGNVKPTDKGEGANPAAAPDARRAPVSG
jgi:hypothetical protein